MYWNTSSGRTYERPIEVWRDYGGAPYHIGYELRTSRTGDGIGAEHALSRAVDQTMRSAGGFTQEISHDPAQVLDRGATSFVIPALFTTAKLFVSDVRLSDADPESGVLPSLTAQERPWLWFQQNLSRHLRPALPGDHVSDQVSLAATLRRRHTRALAIVSPAGLEHFLRVAQHLKGDRL